MARDFKNSSANRRSYLRQSAHNGAKDNKNLLEDVPKFVQVGVVIGLVIAAFAAGSLLNKDNSAKSEKPIIEVKLEENPEADLAVSVKEIKTQPEVPTPQPEEKLEEKLEENPEPRINFTFYTDLSQEKLKVDVEPLPVELKKPLWIQAASTLDEAAAVREQERLTSEGIEILISTGITKNGARAYRLVTGPFTDKRDLNSTLNRLKIKGSDGFAIPDPFAKADN